MHHGQLISRTCFRGGVTQELTRELAHLLNLPLL